MGKDQKDDEPKPVYFRIEKMYSEKTEADPDLADDVPDMMVDAANAAIKSNKKKGVTTDKPDNKNDKVYTIGGTLTKLTKETKGSQAVLSCEVNLVLQEMPGKKLIAGNLFGRTKVMISSEQTAKQLKDDAKACVSAATKGAVETAIGKVAK